MASNGAHILPGISPAQKNIPQKQGIATDDNDAKAPVDVFLAALQASSPPIRTGSTGADKAQSFTDKPTHNGLHATSENNPAIGSSVTTAAIPSHQENSGAPDCIVFSSESTGAYHVLPGTTLQKMPRHVIGKLLQLPELQGKGYPALYLGPIPHSRFESLVRLQQFNEHGDYEPISLPRSAQLKWLSRGLGTIEYYDSKSKEVKPWHDNPTYSVYAAPDATRELFQLELDTYLLSLELSYPALQARSRERIFRCYPKTISGVLALIEKIFQPAAQAKDTEMMDRIREYVNTNGRALIGCKGYIGLMRNHVKATSPLGQVLWETYISACEGIRRELDKPRVGSEKDSKPAPAPIKTNALPAAPAAPSAPSAHSAAVSAQQHSTSKPFEQSESARTASNLKWLLQSLHEGNLIRATQDGFGTLRRDQEYALEKRWTRNQDFKFVKNELLVIDRSKSSTVSSTHNNVVVINAKGEVGDVFRSLTRPISFADMGLPYEANGRSFEGTPPQTPLYPSTFQKKRKWSMENPSNDYVTQRQW